MSELAKKKCEACREDAPTVLDAQIIELNYEVPDWDVLEIEEIKKLKRTFTFKTFVEAQAFTNKVADLAEEEGHHPRIELEWGKVTVWWWTHKIHGLHMNDFIMAAKTDELYE